jgi:uncharacterized OB-fold protein
VTAAVAQGSAAQRPIGPDVFTWPSEDPRLIGSRCGECATVVFPAQDGCPRCGTPGMARAELSRTGTLWTWTTQDFLPKSPYAGPETEADFAGYLLGYVELAEGVRVISRLLDLDRADVAIGMELELRIFRFNVDEDGTEVLAYGFAPVGPA